MVNSQKTGVSCQVYARTDEAFVPVGIKDIGQLEGGEYVHDVFSGAYCLVNGPIVEDPEDWAISTADGLLSPLCIE